MKKLIVGIGVSLCVFFVGVAFVLAQDVPDPNTGWDGKTVGLGVGEYSLILPVGIHTHRTSIVSTSSASIPVEGIMTYRYDPYTPKCDTIISPDYWTNDDVRAYTNWVNCDDRCSVGEEACDGYFEKTLSGCNPKSFTEKIIQNNGIRVSVEAADMVGHKATCSENSTPSKIDRKKPILGSIRLHHFALELSKESISNDADVPTKYRANHGALNLLINLFDSFAGTDDSGSQSGKSGINFDDVAVGTLKASKEALNAQILQINKEIKRIGDEIKLRAEDIRDNKILRYAEKVAEIKTLDQQYIENSNLIMEAENYVPDREAQIALLNGQIELRKNRKTKLEGNTELSVPDADGINLLNESISAKNKEITGYKNSISILENQILDLEDQMVSNAAKYDSMLAPFIDTPDILSADPLSIAEFHESTNNLPVSIARKKDDINMYNDSISSANDEVLKWEDEKEVLSSTIDELKAQIVTIEGQIGELNKKIIAYVARGDIAELEGKNLELIRIAGEKQEARASLQKAMTERQDGSAADDSLLGINLLRMAMMYQYGEIKRIEDELIALGAEDAVTLDTAKITKLRIKRLSDGKEQYFINATLQGQEDTGGGPNFEWNINGNFDGEPTYPIFSKAGKYELQFYAYDKAGNLANPSSSWSFPFFIEIFPANAYQDKSDHSTLSIVNNSRSMDTLIETCGENARLYANALDRCNFSLRLTDPYENILPYRNFALDTDSLGLNPEGSYDTLDDANQAFRNGLRMVDSWNTNVTDLDVDVDAVQSFGIKALVPSVIIHPTWVGGEEAYLMGKTQINQPIPLLVRDVDERGGLIAPPETTSLVYSFNLLFEPWVQLRLTDKETGVSPTDPLQFLIGSEQTIYGFADTNWPSQNLPSGFAIYIKGHRPSNTLFKEENVLAANLGKGGKHKFTGISNHQARGEIKTHLQVPDGVVVPDLQVAFSSRVYQPAEDGKTVIYPGGNLGNQVGGISGPFFDLDSMDGPNLVHADDSTVEALVIGADIEGQILTADSFSYQIGTDAGGVDDPRILKMGNVSVTDVREDITREAYKLIRNKAVNNTGVFNVFNFVDGDVTYYQGDVRFTGSRVGMGRHTVVIEDGNLLIDESFDYFYRSSSLGVILINSSFKPDGKPDKGNIFINNDVSKFVGTYFADGTLTSTYQTGDPPAGISIEHIDRDSELAEDPSSLGKQLLLEGTIFTRNTLGGGMPLTEWVNPWGRESYRDKAQKYDLHFMRRYYPRQGEPSYAEENCVKDVNGNCDPNKHAFVIRPDGRVQNNPPPGFSK